MTSSNVQALLRFAEMFAPVLKNSKFKETGVLTPEEFVAAGEFLVYKCPTWSWGVSEPSKVKSYLPADKQFLITKRVPCYKRVKDMEYNETDEADGDEWVVSHNAQQGDKEEVTELVSDLSLNKPAGNEDDDDDEGEPLDLDSYEGGANLVEEDDPAALNTAAKDSSGGDNILKTRTYDLSITYDNYYKTPRLWLTGYSENGQSLTHKQIMEDMSADHAAKTVTIEPHPHLNSQQASIHPCKHSNVMKRIIDHLVENGKDLRVDQYLILFLKFVSAIIPTIDYDYTTSMDA